MAGVETKDGGEGSAQGFLHGWWCREGGKGKDGVV